MAGLSRPFHSQDACNVAALLPQRGRNLAGLGCAPFARHYWGYHCCFLFLRVLRCFSSPGSPPASAGYQVFNLVGCPIRRSRDQRPFAPTPGLSQLVTSFIACESLGIRHVPFHTFTVRSLKGCGLFLLSVALNALLFTYTYIIYKYKEEEVKLYSCSCTSCQRTYI